MRSYKPTLKQKKHMLKAGLNWQEWQVIRETAESLEVIHARTGKQRVIALSSGSRVLEDEPCIS